MRDKETRPAAVQTETADDDRDRDRDRDRDHVGKPSGRGPDDYIAQSGREGRQAAREILQSLRERVARWHEARLSN